MAQFDVWFVTNRLPEGNGFGPLPDPGGVPRGGRTSVSRSLNNPDRTEDMGDSPVIATQVVGALGPVLDEFLARSVKDAAVPLVLLPGFANTFASGVQRAAQLTEWFAAVGCAIRPLVMSWPSDGKTFGPPTDLVRPYRSDQADSKAAGPAIAELLRELVHALARSAKAGRQVGNLTLLAHSMGNRALRFGLESLFAAGGVPADAKAMFHQAVCAAADDDDTQFEPTGSLRHLAWLAAFTTILTNADPVLTLLSEKIADNPPRLGNLGPRDLTNLPENVVQLECLVDRKDAVLAQGGVEWDAIGHQYYRNEPLVRRDLLQVFAGLPPQQVKKRRKVTTIAASKHARLRPGMFEMIR